MDIDWDVTWTHVRGKLRGMRWKVNGSLETSATATFTGGGKFAVTVPQAIPDIPLGAVVLSGFPPIVLVPNAGLDLGVSAEISAQASFGAKSTAALGAGFEWRDGRTTWLHDLSLTGSVTSPLESRPTLTATEKIWGRAALRRTIDGIFGPTIRPEIGVEATDKLPCPGRTNLDAYAKGKVSADLKLFGKSLAKISATVAEVTLPLIDREAPGCATPVPPSTPVPPVNPLTIGTTRLPDGFLGIDYTGGPAGSGGTRPYTWTATGLPPGLTMGADGTVTGRPTVAATSSVTVTLTDAAGARVTRTYPLTVNAELPPPAAGGVVVVAPAPSCGTYCTTSWGDPHLRTFDGVSYDFQRVGEFTAVRAGSVSWRSRYASSRGTPPGWWPATPPSRPASAATGSGST